MRSRECHGLGAEATTTLVLVPSYSFGHSWTTFRKTWLLRIKTRGAPMWKQFKMVCYCSNQQWMIYCLCSAGTSFMVVPAEDEQEVQMDVLQRQASWLSFNQPPIHTKVWCLDKSSFPVRLKVFREEGNWVDFRHGNLVGRCDDVPKRHRAQSYARAFQMPLLIHSHHSLSSSMSRQFCQILPLPSLLHQLPFQAPYFKKKGRITPQVNFFQ